MDNLLNFVGVAILLFTLGFVSRKPRGTASAPTRGQVSFMDLPADVRLMVYRETFSGQERDIDSLPFHALLCFPGIYAEVFLAVFAHSTFRINLRQVQFTPGPNNILSRELRAPWIPNIQHISPTLDVLPTFARLGLLTPNGPNFQGGIFWTALQYLPNLESLDVQHGIQIGPSELDEVDYYDETWWDPDGKEVKRVEISARGMRVIARAARRQHKY